MPFISHVASLRLLPLLALLLMTGCASVNSPDARVDPLEPFNREVYAFNADFDAKIAKPTAKAYQRNVPHPVRRTVANFFSNLDDVVVLINDLLQFKGEQAVSDTLRLSMNTVFGLFGLLDIATPAGLPKHNEDFGQTLGYWGLTPGPYVVLPFLGPSDVRDTAGLGVDMTYFNPINEVDRSRVRLGMYLTRAVSTRAQLLKATNVLEQAALDPYVFTRDAYLQRRRNLVYDGNPPPQKFDDDFNDDFELPGPKPANSSPASPPATPPPEGGAPSPASP